MQHWFCKYLRSILRLVVFLEVVLIKEKAFTLGKKLLLSCYSLRWLPFNFYMLNSNTKFPGITFFKLSNSLNILHFAALESFCTHIIAYWHHYQNRSTWLDQLLCLIKCFYKYSQVTCVHPNSCAHKFRAERG